MEPEGRKLWPLGLAWLILFPVSALYGLVWGESEVGCAGNDIYFRSAHFCATVLGEKTSHSNMSPQVWFLTAAPFLILLVPGLGGLLSGHRRMIIVSMAIAVAIGVIGYAVFLGVARGSF